MPDNAKLRPNDEMKADLHFNDKIKICSQPGVQRHTAGCDLEEANNFLINPNNPGPPPYIGAMLLAALKITQGFRQNTGGLRLAEGGAT